MSDVVICLGLFLVGYAAGSYVHGIIQRRKIMRFMLHQLHNHQKYCKHLEDKYNGIK